MLALTSTPAHAETSYNGWERIPTRDTGLLTQITVAGKSAWVRKEPVSTVLNYVAWQFHERVEAVLTFSGHRTDDENNASNGHRSSNHMSGTAIDLNGFKHPYKQPHGFSVEQVREIDTICAETSATVYWGGYFGGGLTDGMHFEIRTGVTAAELASVAATLGGAPAPVPTPTPQPDEEDDMLKRIRTTDGGIYLVSLDPAKPIFRGLTPTENSIFDRLGIPIVWNNLSAFERDQVRQQVRDLAGYGITS
jgi:hypothetical protein